MSRSGKKRHCLVLERRTKNLVDFEAAGEWIELTEVWASVTPLRGVETISGAQQQPVQTHLIEFRWVQSVLEAIDENMRAVRTNGNLCHHYYFESVINVDERNREIAIGAREEVRARDDTTLPTVA